MDLPASTASSCLRRQTDDPAIRFWHETRIIQPGVAVASQLTFGELVSELGLDYHNTQQTVIRGRRKADLEVDLVLFGKDFRPFEDTVIRQIGNLQGFEECADASGSQLSRSPSEKVRKATCGLRFGQFDSPVGCEGVKRVIRSEGAEHDFQNVLIQVHGARLG